MGAEEFQEAIGRHVRQGHTFKGFPLQTNHCSAKRIFLTCLGYVRSKNAIILILKLMCYNNCVHIICKPANHGI